jgi:GNAT superfamily N-acetyltransferase
VAGVAPASSRCAGRKSSGTVAHVRGCEGAPTAGAESSVPASAPGLRIEGVSEATTEDWRTVHNIVIPTTPLSSDEVQERVGRYLLTVAYAGDHLVGCATVRPPDDAGTVTVIVRVLPDYRRHGYGEEYLRSAMEAARGLGGTAIETVVLESNADGLRFARRHGFEEISRLDLPNTVEPSSPCGCHSAAF